MTTDARRRVSRAGTPANEKAWQAMVVALARDLGWGVQYVTDSRRSPAGWLDLYCARERDGRRLAIELKMPGRKPTPCQERWIALHNATGTLATVAYPDDWPWIVELLR